MQVEQELITPAPVKVRLRLDEATWRGHISAAHEFSGSDPEYCESHGLSFSQFRKNKRKFGVTAERGRPRKAFVEVKEAPDSPPPTTGPENESTMTRRSVSHAGLPDPVWLAEFAKSLLNLR